MFRFISVEQRKRRFKKDEQRTLALFHHHIKTIETLPPYQLQPKKLLLIRLDDIGDYLLFRNTLPAYKQSARWNNYNVTLLGNTAWKELFFMWDRATVDNAIWINKKEYLQNDTYKQQIWLQLRQQGYEAVICPSFTRPILLDDLCRLATGAQTAIGFYNFTPHKRWKEVSDALYSELFQPKKITHEFFINQQFAELCCGVSLHLQRSFVFAEKRASEPYIACFIGASTKSRRWIVKGWMQLIHLINHHYSLSVKIIGVAPHKEEAMEIAAKTKAESVTDTSLTDVVDIINNAALVIANDTMMAHLAVSCHVPVVIISSGNNCTRFTVYEEAGIRDVCAVYPKLVEKKRNRSGDEALHNHIVVTADIASIKADAVFAAVQQVLQKWPLSS